MKEEQANKQQILQILDALCIIHHITELTEGQEQVDSYIVLSVEDLTDIWEENEEFCQQIARVFISV